MIKNGKKAVGRYEWEGNLPDNSDARLVGFDTFEEAAAVSGHAGEWMLPQSKYMAGGGIHLTAKYQTGYASALAATANPSLSSSLSASHVHGNATGVSVTAATGSQPKTMCSVSRIGRLVTVSKRTTLNAKRKAKPASSAVFYANMILQAR